MPCCPEPTPEHTALVQCPRCGGKRVELRWFAGDQVRIVGCRDCIEKREREALSEPTPRPPDLLLRASEELDAAIQKMEVMFGLRDE